MQDSCACCTESRLTGCSRAQRLSHHEDLLASQRLVQARMAQLVSVQHRLQNARSLAQARWHASMQQQASVQQASVGGAAGPPPSSLAASCEVDAAVRIAESRGLVRGQYDSHRRTSDTQSSRRANGLRRWSSFGSFDSNVSMHESVLECAACRPGPSFFFRVSFSLRFTMNHIYLLTSAQYD